MMIKLCATMLVLSISSIGIAYAGDGEGATANTQFTVLRSAVAQLAVQNGHAVAATHNATPVYTTQQSTISEFSWNPNEGVGG